MVSAGTENAQILEIPDKRPISPVGLNALVKKNMKLLEWPYTSAKREHLL